MNPLFPIYEDQGWKLLEEKSINDRTLVAWYNPNDKVISLAIFHLTDQPNELSKRAKLLSTWGYPTHFATQMMTAKEAAEVVSLYLKDMENDSCWWEKT